MIKEIKKKKKMKNEINQNIVSDEIIEDKEKNNINLNMNISMKKRLQT